MGEVGIDLSSHRSEAVETFVSDPPDLVITVCSSAAASCPTFPGRTRTLHWPFDDPAEARGTDDEVLAVFRRVRDEDPGPDRGVVGAGAAAAGVGGAWLASGLRAGSSEEGLRGALASRGMVFFGRERRSGGLSAAFGECSMMEVSEMRS